MSRPVDFPGTNVRMMPPRGRDDIEPVMAFRNQGCCVTCWQLEGEALEQVRRTGRVFLSVFMGGGMPPVFVGSEAEVRDLIVDYGGTFPRSAEAEDKP